MNRKLRFTKRAIEALAPPDQGRDYYYDLGQDNLAICVMHSGTRTFYRVGRISGRPVRLRIGRYPDLTIEKARNAVRKMNGEIAAGEDPHAKRQQRRGQPTFGDLWVQWREHMEAHKRPKSQSEDRRQYRTYLEKWAQRPLSEINRGDIAALHAKTGRTRGGYTANRLLALISAMFNEGRRAGLFSSENPAAGIRRFKEAKRDRWLDAAELKEFFRALNQELDEVLRDFFLMCLLTGARKSNVARMRWEEVNLERGLWRIPEAKGGTVVVVPLVAPAVLILRSRQPSPNGHGWVFNGRSREGHINPSNRAWRRIIGRAGLQNVRIHDLRRTLGSWMAMQGTTLQVIGKGLGHRCLQATEVYARLSTDPVREAVDKATTAMLQAANGAEEGGNHESR